MRPVARIERCEDGAARSEVAALEVQGREEADPISVSSRHSVVRGCDRRDRFCLLKQVARAGRGGERSSLLEIKGRTARR